MLNKQENEVMRAVYEMCDGRESCLVSPLEIMSILPEKRRYTPRRAAPSSTAQRTLSTLPHSPA